MPFAYRGSANNCFRSYGYNRASEIKCGLDEMQVAKNFDCHGWIVGIAPKVPDKKLRTQFTGNIGVQH
ncbi:hypothetical protein GS610_20700 [Ruegeria sp. HKCCD6228]|uniref:hypothetical protein n=1 Tax=unclassified Ruegeria TaxID=2625375 RepID=UPI001487DE51|nr:MULTISPECIES: hypothetical protein [unclassified Ruegeria]NOD99635.1 hypothetical protein [Ruegeria sp. HKCCD6228]